MPKKGQFTALDAVKNGVVPAAPVGRVINDWAARHWWLDEQADGVKKERMVDIGSTGVVSAATGIHVDTISKVRSGKKEWIQFDNADRIVTFIDPFLWHSDPELADIYQNFDFTHLDLGRPTSPEADPLRLVVGLSDKAASVALGVSITTINRRRQLRGFGRRQRIAA